MAKKGEYDAARLKQASDFENQRQNRLQQASTTPSPPVLRNGV